MLWRLLPAAAVLLAFSAATRAESADDRSALAQFAGILIHRGQDDMDAEALWDKLGFPQSALPRGLEVAAERATDHLDHVAQQALLHPPDGKDTPTYFIFRTVSRVPAKPETYYFVARIDGILLKACAERRGSFAAQDMLLPDIQLRFRHELDFWLKGKYRRKSTR